MSIYVDVVYKYGSTFVIRSYTTSGTLIVPMCPKGQIEFVIPISSMSII